MGMCTDPYYINVTDPCDTKNNPTFIYMEALSTDEHFAKYLPEYTNLDESKAHYERGGLGDMKVKKFLNAVMQETLEPIRLRREELAKDIPAVWDMLYKGSEEARAVAAATLADVKKAMKIDYFADRQ
jgi:tryptophanyl-tRNA synthetase